MPYDLTQEQRDKYRATSIRSKQRKQDFLRQHQAPLTQAQLFEGRFDVRDLMPQLESNELSGLSLFSGGAGLARRSAESQACILGSPFPSPSSSHI